MQQKNQGRRVAEPILVQCDGHLLTVSQLENNKISIAFDQEKRNLRHQVLDHQLSKINYQTVISSLKKQHPQILSASLQRNSDQIYVLSISVKYEFLPEINQQIFFEKRELKDQQLKQVGVKNMLGHLYNLKQQVQSLSSVQVLTSEIRRDFQQALRIPHQKTLYSWTLHLHRPSGSNLKAQLYFFNSSKKQKKSSTYVPDQGLYLYHNGNECTVQLRFFVEQSEKYDQVLFTLQGDWRGRSIIAVQRL